MADAGALPGAARPVAHEETFVATGPATRVLRTGSAAVDLPVGVLGDAASAQRAVPVDDAHQQHEAHDDDLHGAPSLVATTVAPASRARWERSVTCITPGLAPQSCDA